MKIENVKQILENNGYICWTDTDRPTLYDGNHKMICYVPMATAERMAKMDGLIKWAEEWGGYYVARSLGAKHTQHENNEHCKRIAENLSDYVSGLVYRCPDCGEIFTVPADCEIYRCPDCGNVAELDEYEQLTVWDYLEDCLDIEYRVSGRHELRSVQIMVACGGPNIYLDTASGRVELYWWGDRADYHMDSDVISALDEWAEEMFEC